MHVINDKLKQSIREINIIAKQPMKTEQQTKRVEIIMLKFKDPEVETKAISRIIENTEWPFKLTIYDNRPNNANTSKIWNKLIAESTCDYVLIMDSDAFVQKTDPCWLTRMMESMLKHEKCGFVVPVSNNVGGQGQKATGPKKYPAEVINRGVWSGFCFLMDKNILLNTGMFDEDFYIYGQDSEFAHRVQRQGKWETYMREDVFVEHIGGYSFKKAHENKDVDRETDKVRAGILYKLKTQV